MELAHIVLLVLTHAQLYGSQTCLMLQIESIRSEMDIEVNRLIAIIHKKNVDLTDLETKLVNRLRWGIVVLQSKNENTIRRQVLQWWRYMSQAPFISGFTGTVQRIHLTNNNLKAMFRPLVLCMVDHLSSHLAYANRLVQRQQTDHPFAE